MDDRARSRARDALTKVPEITAIFWVLKLLTTGMGEAMSDFLGSKRPDRRRDRDLRRRFRDLLQMRQREYRAPFYWVAVMMVAIFGTMAADGVLQDRRSGGEGSLAGTRAGSSGSGFLEAGGRSARPRRVLGASSDSPRLRIRGLEVRRGGGQRARSAGTDMRPVSASWLPTVKRAPQ
jgi:hypothetical protein